MLRTHLPLVWFKLPDEAADDAINESHAMRQFIGLSFATRQIPDATTPLLIRYLLEKPYRGRTTFRSRTEAFDASGWILRGENLADTAITAGSSSTKCASLVVDVHSWTFAA